jgi:hypothetical protein
MFQAMNTRHRSGSASLERRDFGLASINVPPFRTTAVREIALRQLRLHGTLSGFVNSVIIHTKRTC